MLNLSNYHHLKSTCLAVLLMLSLSHCASEPEIKLPPKSSKALTLNIENLSADFVDSIQFKPCGTPAKYYATAAERIKPNERVSINIYDLCVDLVAVDGFRQTLHQKSNFRPTQIAVWKLK